MGRPWWYDSYWEKNKKPKRRFRFPRSSIWVWVILLALVAAVTLWRTRC